MVEQKKKKGEKLDWSGEKFEVNWTDEEKHLIQLALTKVLAGVKWVSDDPFFYAIHQYRRRVLRRRWTKGEELFYEL